jgi:hypothetical protein
MGTGKQVRNNSMEIDIDIVGNIDIDNQIQSKLKQSS